MDRVISMLETRDKATIETREEDCVGVAEGAILDTIACRSDPGTGSKAIQDSSRTPVGSEN